MKTLENLLENNRLWAAAQIERNPDFFKNLAVQQTPNFLWLGCSDSRVPASEIASLEPGDMFVHRNVSNIVVQTDFNFLSVLQFAVHVLKVENVIVCGHYGCGGVAAAISKERHGLIDNWLRPIRQTQEMHLEELSVLDAETRYDRLCELNVIENAKNVARTTIMQDAWDKGQKVAVHSWIYRLSTGIITAVADSISEPLN